MDRRLGRISDMKRPRLRIRTILSMVAVVCAVPLGWVLYQFNWIRQRHEFLREGNVLYGLDMYPSGQPWQLAIFGEESPGTLRVPNSQIHRARELFPESTVY
jgi:hypothetical protein